MLIVCLLGCFPLANANYKDSDHILSGTTKLGKHWQIYINCYVTKNNVEIIKGFLEIEGVMFVAKVEGEVVETTLANLKYFGGSRKEGEKVVGWYFESWPQTCSYLPK